MLTHSTVHNPDRYMADLRQVLSQGRKRIGLLVGAGAPTAVLVNDKNLIVDDGNPLIPDVNGLTEAVVTALEARDQNVVQSIRVEIEESGHTINIETILTQIRRLAQAIGHSTVHGLNGQEYSLLGERICSKVGMFVSPSLPESANPFSELISWISGTQTRTFSRNIHTKL